MGIQYSRTVESTGSFALPQELLRWKPTCHHTISCWCGRESVLHATGMMKKCRSYI
ncbi:MAG: hypothetical protein ACLUW8_01000 [Subdoligranulum sp.]